LDDFANIKPRWRIKVGRLESFKVGKLKVQSYQKGDPEGSRRSMSALVGKFLNF